MSSAAALPILANDFRAQWAEVRGAVLAAVDRVGQSGWLILGKEVERFEDALAAYWGLKFAVGTANGMDALEIALRAGGLPSGGKVLTTPLSAFASSLAIVRAGGVPVFVDVDERGLMDLAKARDALTADASLRWLLPVHLYGQCLDLDALERLRAEFDLRIVEDCAQSIGAKWRGKPCGTVGLAAATSFYPTKNLGAMGDGGALLMNDATLAQAARQWRDYGQSAKYVHSLPGLNSRLDELQAAILHDALLPRLERFTQRRREIAAYYERELRREFLSPIRPAPGCESVYHLFPVVAKVDRDGLLRHLREAGIHAAVHYPELICEQPALRNTAMHVLGPLEQARRIAQGEISLPMHPFLPDADVERVVAACNAWRPASN